MIFATYRYIYDYMGYSIDAHCVFMMQLPKLIYFSYYYDMGKIQEFPSILDFLGYVFFYPSTLAGPVFDFNYYLDYIYRRKQYEKIPFKLWPIIEMVLIAFCLMGAYVYINAKW